MSQRLLPAGNYSAIADNLTFLSIQEHDLLHYVLSSTLLVSMMCSMLLNGVLLLVLRNIAEDHMKTKFFVQNSVITDIVLSLSFGTRYITQIAQICGVEAFKAVLCSQAVFVIRGMFCALCQVFASLAVVIDRIFSVKNPLRYHVSNYSKRHKVAIALCIWCVPAILSIPTLFAESIPNQPIGVPSLCYSIYVGTFWSKGVLPAILILTITLVLLLYIGIIYVVFKSRRASGSLGGTTHDLRKNGISTTVTFFLVYLAYILFYLPLLVFYPLADFRRDVIPGFNIDLSLTFLNVYILNSLVDPIIYVIRIRVLRKHVLRYIHWPRKRPLSSRVNLNTCSGTDMSIYSQSNEPRMASDGGHMPYN